MRTALTFILVALGLIAFATPARAHIGSSTVVFDENGGAYPARIVVRPPDVIPGRAQIDVRFLDADLAGVKVSILPVAAGVGLKGAPPPDEALPVPGEPTLRHGELWIMTGGSYSVQVGIVGPRGQGTVVVPLDAVATKEPRMAFGLGALLAALGVLLVTSAVTLAVQATRESTLPPGETPTTKSRRGAYIAAIAAVVLFGYGLSSGKHWWDSEDDWYRAHQLYHPPEMRARLRGGAESPRLDLSLWTQRTPAPVKPVALLPEHGKLMHLFVVREPSLDIFAHLHPQRISGWDFETELKDLPAGTYQLYGDVTTESGFSATLTSKVELPAKSSNSAGLPNNESVSSDPDDAFFGETGVAVAPAEAQILRMKASPLHAGAVTSLQFEVNETGGAPATLEPYLGMQGHAALVKTDGSVFAHLHPGGTISMASQMYFEKQSAELCSPALVVAHDGKLGGAAASNLVAFPYEFPSAGHYRLWVQVKVHGHIVTNAFDLDVAARS